MNEIVKRASSELATAFATSLVEGIDNSRAETPVMGGGKPLLRLLKSGTWVFGQADDPVQEGSRWAINPHSIMHGFTCWSDYPGNVKNELLGERMVPVTQRKPLKPEPIGGFEFKEQRIFEAKCMLGEDEGIEVLFKTNSIGGMRTFDTFLAELRKQAVKNPTQIVAIVEFESTSYNHSKYGQIFTPILNIRGWSGMDEDEATEVASAPPKAGNGGAAARAPVRPAKPPLRAAAQAQAPVDAAGEEVDDILPDNTPPPAARPGAAPRRQRPSTRA